MMSTHSGTVVIVGAGSVGVVTGYDLTRAGAQVTFLVRPHRTEQLARPQALYSYDDSTVDHFSDYEVITSPTALSRHPADIVIVTLDGAALHAEAGLHLVDHIGRAYRGTRTGVVLATGGIGMRGWFVQQSGLAREQVAMGSAAALIHEVPAAGLPSDPAVDQELLASADYAYRHQSPAGFVVDDSAPEVTEALLTVYSGDGVPAAASVPADQLAVGVANLAPILAWGLLGWRPLEDVEASDPTWQLAVDAMHEIQRLPVFGAAGRAAAEQTQPATVLESFRQTAQAVRPLGYAAFNAYHHGDKVNRQDLDILEQARHLAAADRVATPALDALIERLSTNSPAPRDQP